MSSFRDGYIADISYSAYYHRAHAPAWLHFVATALGYRAPDPSRPYRWCELGCGPGFGAALLAAANPHAQFHAIDFNPAHIQAARAWQTTACLDNLTLEQTSFSECAARTGPPAQGQYDYIVLTGVYAWLSAENQAAIRAIIHRDLRPGGIVHLAYPCLPAMASMIPLRNLFREYASQAQGGAVERAAYALDRVRALGHADAAYLKDFPALLQSLDQILPDQLSDIAHDYLAEHWRPLDAGEVVSDFANIECDWLGSAQPADNIDAVCLPPAVISQINTIASPSLRESARAFAANQALRADMYQRAAPDNALSPSEHRDMLMRQRIYGPAGSVGDERASHVISEAPYHSLRSRLNSGAALSFTSAARLPEYASQPGALNSAFQLLAGSGQAMPVLEVPPNPQTAQAFNHAVATAVLQGQVLDTLAAPALGAGIAANLPQMAALLVVYDDARASGSALRRKAWDWVRHYRSAQVSGEPGSTFLSALDDFEAVTLPIWRQLGVVS